MLHFRMNMPFYLMAVYGSLMIIIVLLLRGLLKNKLPRFVFPVLWGVVLFRFLIPFSLSSPLSARGFGGLNLSVLQYAEAVDTAVIEDVSLQQGTGETTILEVAADYAENYAFFHMNPRLGISLVWVLGAIVTAAILFLQKYRYSRKLKVRFLLEHNETINTILREMNMGHILVFTNDEIASPMVCGLWNPRIYLPTRMNFENAALLRDILTHETMHIKRRDNWMKAVMLAVLCLNWFNPLVWIMSICLSSDLEAACDAAVLRICDEDGRKGYASSLLTMAITGNRSTLLYSAFSKTEVERRIKNVLHYKKASALMMIFSVLFLLCGTVAFATGVQAPFSQDLTSFCAGSSSRWGVRVKLARDIALGENPQKRAEDIVFAVLAEDTEGDPDILEKRMETALADEFGVEKRAFRIEFSLCLNDEERNKEYAEWEITRDKDSFHSYKGEKIRTFIDEMEGFYQSRPDGSVDLTIHRDRFGFITSVTALREGDTEFDRRTGELERERSRYQYNAEYNTVYDTAEKQQTTVTEDVPFYW